MSRSIGRLLGIVLSATVVTTLGLRAQPLRAERQSFARLMQLRSELLDAWLRSDPERRADLAEAFAAADDSDPFAATMSALAAADGRALDFLARVRGGTVLLALPEVVDGERFQAVHATLWSPRRLPDELPPLVVEFELLEADGKPIARSRVDRRTAPDDLTRYRAKAELPLEDRTPRRLRVRALVALGDSEPALIHEKEVFLQPDFAKRAEKLPMLLLGTAPDVARHDGVFATLPSSARVGLPAASLRALTWSVEQPFSGEPRLPNAHPLEDLMAAEAFRDALREGEDAFAALKGRRTIAVPLGERSAAGSPLGDHAMVSIDFDAVRADRASGVRRPLVLVLPGTPSWSARLHRPDSPKSLHPAWTVEALRRVDFDSRGRGHLVVMESPGRFRSAVGAVLDVLEQLREFLPIDEVLLVGEREGGYAVARAALSAPGVARRVVVIDGGGVTRADLEQREDVEFLVVGSNASASLEAVTKLAEATGRARWRPVGAVPWPIVMPSAHDAIEEFLFGEGGGRPR
ncbi:MAG: hypothetical protein AB7I19_02695 [Planctomycetota bacterium]